MEKSGDKELVTKGFFRKELRKELRTELNKLLEDIDSLIKLEVGLLRDEVKKWHHNDGLRITVLENRVDVHEERLKKLETAAS